MAVDLRPPQTDEALLPLYQWLRSLSPDASGGRAGQDALIILRMMPITGQAPKELVPDTYLTLPQRFRCVSGRGAAAESLAGIPPARQRIRSWMRSAPSAWPTGASDEPALRAAVVSVWFDDLIDALDDCYDGVA